METGVKIRLNRQDRQPQKLAGKQQVEAVIAEETEDEIRGFLCGF